MIEKIVQLDKAKWQDYPLPFRFTSYNYYDAEIMRTGDNFSVSFTKKPFEQAYEKTPDSQEKLFQDWYDDAVAWGIEDGDRLLAAIETCVETWNNRLRINELWVDDSCRRMGVATALMNIAIKRAKDEGRRAVILETQSNNEGAVKFYLQYGFSLAGFDTCAYQNDDVSRKEVRLEFVYYLE